MSDCGRIFQLLYPYLDGELDEGDRCRVHAHLLECLTCQDAFNAERSFLHLLRINTSTEPAPITPKEIAKLAEKHSPSDADPLR